MHLSRLKIGAIFAALFLARLTAADASVEDRLKALEQKVQDLAKENSDLKKQLGWKDNKAPVLVQPAGHESKLVLGGFLQAQAEFGRAADQRWSGVKDRFFFRRARIYALGGVGDFDFKAELDLQGNTLGAATGQLARANEVFVNWHKFSAANVRFGQLKPAFGYEQLSGDTKLLGVERSLSSDRIADGRQMAVSVGGELPDYKLGYLVVVGNGNGSNVSANDNSKFQKSARVYATPLATKDDKVVIGASGLWTDDVGVSKSGFGFAGNLFTGERSAWGADASWTHGPFDFFGEYLHATFKPTTGAQFDAEGWQASAAYFVVPAKVQAMVRREEFDPSTSAGGNTIRSWVFGVNWFVHGEDVKVMLDYMIGRVPGANDDGGRLLTRVQVLF